MAGKLGRQNYDWGKLKTEYVTSSISLKKLAEKHGIRYPTVCERSSKEGWVEERKKHIGKTCAKACAIIEDQQANMLAKELAAADRISDVLTKAFEDPDQFQRHLVQMKMKKGKEEKWWVEEEIFEKVDMKALKDAAQSLRLVETMKRSMQDILTMQEHNRIENDKRRLAIDERRLELEEKKYNQGSVDDSQCGVVILSPVLEDSDE